MKKKPTPKSKEPNEYLILGHMIKYNLYLLSKAVVFSAVAAKTDSLQAAVEQTEKVMHELDLDAKRRL